MALYLNSIPPNNTFTYYSRMKSTRKITLLLACLFASALLLMDTGCTSTATLTVLEPGHITLPQDINKFALVNRYRPAKGGSSVWNVLEGIFTGENIGQDRRGAETSLYGLQDALRNSPRFEFTMPNLELRGGGVGNNFPDPLSTQEVQQICRDAGTQALITIESFDSDSRLDYSIETEEKKTKNEKTYIDTTHVAIATVNVTVGWRMYDGKTGNLLDQFRMVEEAQFDAEGRTPNQAHRNLPNQEYVSNDMGARTGMRYSRRISPTWVNVSRNYYSKGSDKLKWARNLARADDWSGAADLWQQEANSAETKVKKRATYNMALAREIEGDLDGAMEWSQKAMRLGVGQADEYYRKLARRQQDQMRLEQQMGGK